MYRMLLLALLLATKASFALDLELTQGINSALPIAVSAFEGDKSGNSLTAVIQHDLEMSGQFRLIPAPMTGLQGASSISMWRQAGADSLVAGRVEALGGDRYQVKFALYDAAAKGRVLLSKSYTISSQEWRALAHHISDEVYQQLIGERGIFSTRIAYVVVERHPDKTRYTLDVADVDGYHPQVLLESNEPIMSPTWSPDGQHIAYVSFERKRAQIYSVTVETGQRRLISSFSGINGAPTWSPDGRHLAVVLSKSGHPKIYTIDMANGHLAQLTFGDTIDTEPRYSPDGRYLLFTSGRGGTPQIYRLALADGQITRITYDGNYNARASYTPNQKFIVMLHREDQQFSIGVQDLERGQVMSITSSPFDESPSVSPNGRLIAYATHVQDKGILAIVSLDGRIKLRLPERNGDVQEPAWSPYLG
jgi:TolB protein